MSATALVGAAIVLTDRVVRDRALLVEGGAIRGVMKRGDVPLSAQVHDLSGGWLLPGFIDTQVNGGGDVLLNDRPDVEGIRTIAAAHRRFGTTGLLPTLISDRPAVVEAAIEAVRQAIAAAVPGVLGIHVEGPHLNEAKRGIHDAGRFSMLGSDEIARLVRPDGGVTLVTLAPELAPLGAIRSLVGGGVVVAAGHSLAGFDETRTAIADGLAAFTHLFNAMTQLGSREPGMVGAALLDRSTTFGLILDGLHVHPATLRVALAARGLDGAMLVTDAMPPVGGRLDRFDLMGREIVVVDGTCRASDGTLAGSALTMAQAFRNAMSMLDLDAVDASRLASGNPARLLGLSHVTGAIASGLRADLVHMDDAFRVLRTWIGGEIEDQGE